VSHRLGNFISQSSRQADLGANGFIYSDARPHPGPLPRGEGEAARGSRKFGHHNCNRPLSTIRAKTLTTSCDVQIVNNRRMILPLLGERAGVRAVVPPNISLITHHAPR